MNTFDLAKILDEIHWEEYAEFDDPPHHIRSLRHRIRWHRMMKHAFEKPVEPVVHSKMKLTPRRLVILLVFIFTAILTAAAIIVWYGSLRGRMHYDNTELFAIVEDAPDVIEEVYEITGLPKGFKLVEEHGMIGEEHLVRRYNNNEQFIIFEQFTWKWFHYNNDEERTSAEKIQINNMDSLIFSYDNINMVYLNTNNYIVVIRTNLERDDTINLLKTLR